MPRSAGVLEVVVRKSVPAVLGAVLAVAPAAAGASALEARGAAEPQATVMSVELLEGAPVGAAAAGLHVQGDLRAAVSSPEGEAVYGGLFRIDTGAAESVAPAGALEAIGVVPAGLIAVERADGTVEDLPFGFVRIEFMGEMREGRIVFGPEDVEPAIGVSALEAIGLSVDPETKTLQRVDAAQ